MIKKALGIGSIHTNASTFYQARADNVPGAQIDLVLERADQIIHLFEIKHYRDTFSLSLTQANDIRRKRQVFQQATDTKKHIFITLITTFGIQPNQHSLELLDQTLQLDDLFV